MKQKFKEPFEVPVTVEFEDVDSYKIAHHTKMVAYLERARVRFFAQQHYDLRDTSIHPVLYHVEMKYKKTVKLLDELIVSVSVKSQEDFKLTLGYRIRRGDELVAKATTTLAFVDGETKELVPVPVKD
jgi:acyl-CoA thioester hydrolase